METRYKYKNFRECVILLQKLFQSDYWENFPTSNSYSYLFFTLSVSINIKKKSLNSKVSKNKKKKKNNNVSLEKYNGSYLKKNS